MWTRQQAKAYARKWRRLNPKKVRESNRKGYARQRRWVKAHPQSAALHSRRYVKKVAGAPQKRWYRKNRAKMRVYHRNWKKSNFLKVREYQMRRYALTGPDRVDYASILKRDGFMCGICGGPIKSRRRVHFDHVVPLSRGGKHNAGNIRPAHPFCNWSKNNLLPDEYRDRQNRLKAFNRP